MEQAIIPVLAVLALAVIILSVFLARAVRARTRQDLHREIEKALERRNAQLLEQVGTHLAGHGNATAGGIRDVQKACSDLQGQLRQMGESHNRLQTETQNLTKLFSNTAARGKWAEEQLAAILELSGMEEHISYEKQVAAQNGLRPDVVVRLPGERFIAIDAKAPMDAWTRFAASGETGDRDEHARAVLEHARDLGRKKYWDAIARDAGSSPQLVVMYLPSDALYSGALASRSDLVEKTAQMNVLVTTPTMLLGLLKAMAFEWRKLRLRDEILQIQKAGDELVRALTPFLAHVDGIRKGLAKSVDAYNSLVGSLDARILPKARRMQKLGAGSEDAQFGDRRLLETAIRSRRE